MFSPPGACWSFSSEFLILADQREYQPDFVAEMADVIDMLEIKARDEMRDPVVVAKRDAAVQWCVHASKHALSGWDGN